MWVPFLAALWTNNIKERSVPHCYSADHAICNFGVLLTRVFLAWEVLLFQTRNRVPAFVLWDGREHLSLLGHSAKWIQNSNEFQFFKNNLRDFPNLMILWLLHEFYKCTVFLTFLSCITLIFEDKILFILFFLFSNFYISNFTRSQWWRK